MSYKIIKDMKDIPKPLPCDTKHKVEWLEQRDLSQAMRNLYYNIQNIQIGDMKYRLTIANPGVFDWEYQITYLYNDMEIRLADWDLFDAYLTYLKTITIETR